MEKLRKLVFLQVALIFLLGILAVLTVHAESSIKLNSILTGTLDGVYDSDTYVFEIPEDGVIEFIVIPESTLSINMYIYGDNGNTKIYWNDWNSKGQTVSITAQLKRGTYYLELEDHSGYGSYTLTNTFTKASKETDTEPNNSFLEAVLVEHNKDITGNLGFYNAKGKKDVEDWYKVVIPEDGVIEFVGVPDSTLGLNMFLYGDNGNTCIFYNDWNSEGTIVSITAQLMPGTYYLRLGIHSGYGSYTITNTFTKETKENDTEPNNSFLEAVLIEHNKAITGHLGFYDTKGKRDVEDWYKVVIPEDGIIEFVGVPDSNLSMNVYLYRDNGTTCMFLDDWNSKGETVSIKAQLMPGTYYLKLGNHSGYGSYTINNTFYSSVKHNKIVMTIGKPNMVFNSQTKEIDPGRGTTPIIINGRTLVPIRSIIESMGGTVEWNDSERKISIVHGATSIELWLGNKQARINGAAKTLDVEPVSISGRTMVPLRFVAENLNCEVNWDDKTKSVIIEF